VAGFGRGGDGDAGDCARCRRSLVGELVTENGRRNAAGSPKIAVEFMGGLKVEDEGKLDTKRVLGDGSTAIDTASLEGLPLSSDEIERT